MSSHRVVHRLLWFLVTTVFALTSVFLYEKLQDVLSHPSSVYHYTLVQSLHNSTKSDDIYSQLSRQALDISHDIWLMSRSARDSKEFRSQLEDMSIQLEARISVMDRISGESERRRIQLIRLAELLERQLDRLQNPPDCGKAKFIVTDLPYCGFGCQVHHVALCLQLAYAHNRTLFVNGQNWFDIFYPVTNCSNPGPDATYQPIVKVGVSAGPSAPPGLTKTWADALRHLHGSPYAWFRGHLVRFILRFKPTTFRKQLFAGLESAHSMPLVGVHVRRTDKIISEAKAYPISRYMEKVEWAYRKLQIEEELFPLGQRLEKKVFLASDDARVFSEARDLYPSFTFIGDENRGKSYWTRNLRRGVQNVVFDVFSLANCDYVVCTFSSNVCRLVYELLLTDVRVHGDRSAHVKSVDEPYFMHGQQRRSWRVLSDIPGGGIKQGDNVTVSRNLWNGSIVTDRGIILPAYLVQENIPLLPPD
ncbi:unnamed protein product [Mesocestoides corti]|uniref:GT23 domain-containing protein n=1 Tax=Mesocestoides corti TaxID=53468 RepID=A0A0R3UM16_MESCO|nr:unnamed protein product [Mesocestoides corti]